MDREAEFRRIYEAHRTAIHAYFVGRTGDRWIAADLMQDVFLRAWQKLPDLVGIATHAQRGWLFTVARNLSIDEHRRERTRAGIEAALRHEPMRYDPPASMGAIAAERVEVVGAAIRRLPEQQRTTLALAAAGGLNSTEIADALGVPAGTVRYRLSLARRTLAAALNGYDHQSHTEGP